MSTFHYMKHGEPLNGVKCDACGIKLYTDTEGQMFGDHMNQAKQKGWLITKENGAWVNLCPECKTMREKLPRAKYFAKTMP